MGNKILFVDDARTFRRFVKMYLAKQHQVVTAENGEEAMNLLQSGYYPDVIISDLQMPIIDGQSMIKMLKADNKLKQIPVIILSGNDKSSERVKLMKSGAVDYIVKPFNPAELEIRLSNLLRPNRYTA
ncbi:MAG: response regulator transcription factor [Saprospiraceae bacterium]|nr:response regulator transcription factor [Saprospiraceae bacterium]